MRFPSYARAGHCAVGSTNFLQTMNDANTVLEHEATTAREDGYRDPPSGPAKVSCHQEGPAKKTRNIQRKYKEAITEMDEQQAAVEEMRRELGALRKEHEGTKALLAARSDELRSVQKFMNTADKASLSDVQGVVGHLNAEIFQLAASIADRWTYRVDNGKQDKARERVEREATNRLKPVIGGRLLGLLRVARHDKDPYCVQVALQAFLALWASEMSTQWGMVLGGEQGKYMQAVYDKLKHSGQSSSLRID